MPFSVVSAFSRLGENYAIQPLFDKVKARLRCAFEPTLEVATRRVSVFRDGKLSLFLGITDRDPRNFQIMILLQEMILQASLPLAMYKCALTCPPAVAIDGYEFKDTFYSLSRANLRSYFFMRTKIFETFRIRLAQNLRVSNGCVVQSSCTCHIHRPWTDEATIGQPFSAWRQEWGNLLCDACRSDLNSPRNAVIEKAWNLTPQAFGFDT